MKNARGFPDDPKTGKPWWLYDRTAETVAALQKSFRKLGEKWAREREEKILELVMMEPEEREAELARLGVALPEPQEEAAGEETG